MIRNWILIAGALGCALPAFSQQVQTRRANITGSGGGDGGKCTIEVRVDGVAEVVVNGATGQIRNLSGTGANWVRFECSSPLPNNPVDFRFRGIDGRGNVQLVQDPRSRGGAVVRIEDRQGGSENYTFDLEWRGGTSNDSGGGFGSGRYDRNDRYDRDRYDRDRYDRDRDGRSNPGRNIVSCGSDGNRRTYCGADTSGGVRVLREHGNSSCRLNQNWGFDRRGIWVERGCRADFQIGR